MLEWNGRTILSTAVCAVLWLLPAVGHAELPSDCRVFIGAPGWYAQFDGAGFCDWYWWGLSPRHEHSYHEMLSGEWAAAIYYDGIATEPSVMWLTDLFRYPYWTTNSTFDVQSFNDWDDVSNPTPPNTEAEDSAENPVTAHDTAQSVLSNGDVRITIDYEVVDLASEHSPLGLRTFKNERGYVESERYVLLQTYTIKNISAGDITGIEFYQMLHGHPADEGSAEVYSVYEAYPYSDPLANYTPFGAAHTVGNFQFDITQWNTGNGGATHVDRMAFRAAGLAG